MVFVFTTFTETSNGNPSLGKKKKKKGNKRYIYIKGRCKTRFYLLAESIFMHIKIPKESTK